MGRMITGTVGVSPVRLLNPGAPGRNLHGSRTSQARPADGGVGLGPAVYLVGVAGPHGCVDGLVVAVDVQDPPSVGGLLPHEETDDRAVRRRLRVLRTARLDRDPVMLTYRGHGEAVALARQDSKVLSTSTQHGVTSTVSAVSAGSAAAVLRSATEQRYLVADGHHRLAATIELVRSGRPSSVTGFLVDADDTPLSLGAIHRVVLDGNGRELVSEPAVTSVLDALRRNGAHVVGPGARVDGRVPPSAPGSSREVVLLHGSARWGASWQGESDAEVVWHVERALAALQDVRIRREPDARTAGAAANRGALTVLLPIPRLDEVMVSAARGILLPYKTTLFQPKLPSGALVRPLPDL